MATKTAGRLTPQQQMRLERNLRAFGCDPDDFVVEWVPFDLPAGWVVITIGRGKGRSFTFGCSPSGDACS